MNILETEPLVKASYMNVLNTFQQAALKKESDNIKGVSSNIMCGQCVPCGTGMVNINLDEQLIKEKKSFFNRKKYIQEEDLPNIHIKRKVYFDFDH